MTDKTEELIRRIKEQAQVFVLDNIPNPRKVDFLIIENAMLVGATIKGVMETEQLKSKLYGDLGYHPKSSSLANTYVESGGWYCPKSSDHYCHYENGDPDHCDFCEEPSERK